MIETGFGSLPKAVLASFHQAVVEYYGYTPLPGDKDWEDVLENAAKTFAHD
jgi:hypothetical protein